MKYDNHPVNFSGAFAAHDADPRILIASRKFPLR